MDFIVVKGLITYIYSVDDDGFRYFDNGNDIYLTDSTFENLASKGFVIIGSL